MVLFAGAASATGSGTVTITVSDQHGNTDQETIPFSTAPNADFPAPSTSMPAPTGIALVSTTPGTTAAPNGAQQYQVSGIEANATVTLYADGQSLGTATASAAGGTVDIVCALSPGNHVFTAVQESRDQESLGTNSTTSSADITGNLVSPQLTLTIDVPNLNPPQFTTTPFADAAPGLTYQYIPSTNQSSSGTISYSLSGQPAGMTIANGVLTWAVPADTPLGTTNTITLNATDTAGNVGTQTFQLDVVAASSLTVPSGIGLALANSGGLPQISPSGTLVGTLSADTSAVNDQFTYSLVDDGANSSGNAAFAIAGNRLFTNVSPPLTAAPYNIYVQATDSSGLSIEQLFSINVVNDTPTGIQLSYARAGGPLQYSPAGTLVGTLASVDPAPADSNTYSLVSGPAGADNASFTIVGNRLFTAVNQLTASSYSIQVRTTDSVGLSFDQAFVISVIPQAIPSVHPVPLPFFTSLENGNLPGTVPLQLPAIPTAPGTLALSLPNVSTPALPSGSATPTTAPSQLFGANVNNLFGTQIGISMIDGGTVIQNQPAELQPDVDWENQTPGSPQSGRDGTGNPQHRPNKQTTDARPPAHADQANIDADAVDAAMETYAGADDLVEQASDG